MHIKAEPIYSRLSAKNVKLARPTLFNYIYTRQEFEQYANELFQMMSKDKMNVRIHEIYPLEDVARAHKVSRKSSNNPSAAVSFTDAHI